MWRPSPAGGACAVREPGGVQGVADGSDPGSGDRRAATILVWLQRRLCVGFESITITRAAIRFRPLRTPAVRIMLRPAPTAAVILRFQRPTDDQLGSGAGLCRTNFNG